MKKQTVIGARESRGGGVNETISLKISKIVRKRIKKINKQISNKNEKYILILSKNSRIFLKRKQFGMNYVSLY